MRISKRRKENEAVTLVEFMHLVFTRMSSEMYRRLPQSFLLYLRYVLCALISSLVCHLVVVSELASV